MTNGQKAHAQKLWLIAAMALHLALETENGTTQKNDNNKKARAILKHIEDTTWQFQYFYLMKFDLFSADSALCVLTCSASAVVVAVEINLFNFWFFEWINININDWQWKFIHSVFPLSVSLNFRATQQKGRKSNWYSFWRWAFSFIFFNRTYRTLNSDNNNSTLMEF